MSARARCMRCDVVFIDPDVALEHFAEHARYGTDDDRHKGDELDSSTERHPAASR